MPPDPPSFSMLCMLGVLCTPALYQSQKGPLFLEKNLPTLSSAYGPVVHACDVMHDAIEGSLL